MTRLAGKTALVTGAASGIGRAIAIAYAAEGAHILCADRADADATAAAAREAGGGAETLILDVTDEQAVATAVDAADRERDGINILVCAAGIIRTQPLLETTRASFQQVIEVNVFGVLFALQAVAGAMIRRGQGGRIINIASIAGRKGDAVSLQYSASKAAVISVTQSAGLALGTHDITVNAIAPGFIQTAMWEEIHQQFAGGPLGATPDAFDANIVSTVALGRLGTPADVVGMALLLAGPDGGYITGQTYNVDGGVAMN